MIWSLQMAHAINVNAYLLEITDAHYTTRLLY